MAKKTLAKKPAGKSGKKAAKKVAAKRPARRATKKVAKQSAKSVSPIPAGMPAVISGFQVRECKKAIEFLKTVFGAKEKDLMLAPDGTIAHCDLQIGNSHVMCGDPMGSTGLQTMRVMMYVKDVDAVFAKATSAGASVKEPVQDQFWGDRTARVVDPCGNEYLLATRKENLSKAEMGRRFEELMAKAATMQAQPQRQAQG